MIDRDNLLIIGGSRGIGLALAREALTKRSRVTVIARTRIHNLQDSRIEFIKQDFNDTSLARSTLTTTQPDMLILCVAQGLYGNPLSFSDEQVFRCIQASYTSTVLWIKEAINVLPERSKLCWISSLTTKVPNQNWSYYASAKAGVEHFIECVRELARVRDISITVCYPGCIATDFHRTAGTYTPEGAINPSKITRELLQAVENRLDFWVSDMDKDVIEEVHKFNEIYRHQFRGLLK